MAILGSRWGRFSPKHSFMNRLKGWCPVGQPYVTRNNNVRNFRVLCMPIDIISPNMVREALQVLRCQDVHMREQRRPW